MGWNRIPLLPVTKISPLNVLLPLARKLPEFIPTFALKVTAPSTVTGLLNLTVPELISVPTANEFNFKSAGLTFFHSRVPPRSEVNAEISYSTISSVEASLLGNVHKRVVLAGIIGALKPICS